MSKLGKMEMERYGGARWAFELIEQKGLEEAKKEFAWRGIQNAPLNIEKAEILRFERDLRENCKKTMCAMTCVILRDVFEYGHDRIERFIRRWNLKVDCLADDLVTWPDYVQILKDEVGIDIDIPICYSDGGKSDGRG